MIKKLTLSTCDKPKCEYYIDQEIEVGHKFGKGIMCHRHCVICTHLNKHDLYTRLKVGE